MNMVSRSDRGIWADWWWSVDRPMVIAGAVLLVLGVMMALAASPAVAKMINLPLYHFANKQMVFLVIAAALTIIVSVLTLDNIRRLAVCVFVLATVGLVFTLTLAPEIKGASRWLFIAGISIQPSEILKPAFVVVCACLFARQNTRLDSSGAIYTFLLLAALSSLLIFQPDIGQMTLLMLVWVGVYYIAGASLFLLIFLGALGLIGAYGVYLFVPHVTSRVDRFLDPSSGDTYQVDRAMEAIRSAGLTGAGPGNGHVKYILPDAHSDYVFAVAAEEGGLLVSGLIVFLFAFIIYRCFIHIRREPRHWVQLSVAGLTILFGLQVCINLAVNLNLMPSKGMTLPFISYGGSSLISSALTFGMLLGLTRRRGVLATSDDPRPTEIRITGLREAIS